MIYLLLAILSSAMISIIMRLSSGKINADLSMLATNYFICTLLSAITANFQLALPQVEGFGTTIFLGIISGGLYLGGFMLFQANTNKYGVVLSSVCMKLGLLVPIVASVLIFREVPGLSVVLGGALTIFGIALYSRESET